MTEPLPRLYFITDRHQVASGTLTDCVAAALAGGVRLVQLREKDLTARDLLTLAREIGALCESHGARLLVNDRADIALRLGCGVHLTSAAPPVAEVRGLLGPRALIGVSTHSPEEIAAAERGGASFVTFGPVFDTPSKRGMGQPLGLEALRLAVAETRLPLFALGGVKEDRIGRILATGAHGVSLISAIAGAHNPASVAATLCTVCNSSKTRH